jgi:hypothetical protein
MPNQLIEYYAARTADSALARDQLALAYQHRNMAVIGTAGGGIGFVGLKIRLAAIAIAGERGRRRNGPQRHVGNVCPRYPRPPTAPR